VVLVSFSCRAHSELESDSLLAFRHARKRKVCECGDGSVIVRVFGHLEIGHVCYHFRHGLRILETFLGSFRVSNVCVVSFSRNVMKHSALGFSENLWILSDLNLIFKEN